MGDSLDQYSWKSIHFFIWVVLVKVEFCCCCCCCSLWVNCVWFCLQSNELGVGASPKTKEGRIIYYHVAEDDGEVSRDEGVRGYSLVFKGNGVEELTRKFEEETGLEGIIVCSRSPLNGKLYPLRLQLPPNNVTMQVVLVLPFSKGESESSFPH